MTFTSPRPSDFFISYAGPDQPWAEWLGQQLESAGYRIVLDVWEWSAGTDFVLAMQHALDEANRVLAVWSPAYFSRVWTGLEQRTSVVADALGEPGSLVPVVVEDCTHLIPRLYRILIRIDLAGLDENEAQRVLLDRLAAPRRPADKVPFPRRDALYPGLFPKAWNIRSYGSFFARHELLSAVRAEFVKQGTTGPRIVALTGNAGTGKTLLAREYALRNASEYTAGWWIQASDGTSLDAGLLGLGLALNSRVEIGDDAATNRVLADLQRLGGRQLLVLDNMPPGGGNYTRIATAFDGDLLLTSRDATGGWQCSTVVVGPFERTESIGLLLQRAPHLSYEEADDLSDALADLPMAIDQAGAYLEAGDTASNYLSASDVSVPGNDKTDDRATASIVANIHRLARLDPAALDLVHQFAFLASEPIPLSASPSLGTGASPGLALSDPQTAKELVGSIEALALARLSGTNLLFHRQVQEVVRRLVTGDRAPLALTRALRLLGTAAPGDPDTPESWAEHGTLAPHLLAAAHAVQ